MSTRLAARRTEIDSQAPADAPQTTVQLRALRNRQSARYGGPVRAAGPLPGARAMPSPDPATPADQT